MSFIAFPSMWSLYVVYIVTISTSIWNSISIVSMENGTN